ncbi:cell adhesion molecule 3-like [Glandiceps talaboti]
MFTFTWYVAISIMAASIPSGVAEPRYVTAPSTSTTDVLIGQDIVLNCQVADYEDLNLFWTVELDDDKFPIGPFSNMNPTAYPRYAIIGDSAVGEYNLRVSSSVFSDAGNYTCALFNSQSNVVLIETVELVVSSPHPPVNDGPTCGSTLPTSAKEGDTASIRCTSTGGRPQARLQWKRGNTRIRGNSTLFEEPVANEGYNAINIYEWPLTNKDDGVSYDCLETHDALSASRKCSIGPFNVQHKPVVRITPNRYEIDIKKVQNITFRCSAKANPDVTEPYVWTFNNTEIELNQDGFSFSNDSLQSRLTVYDVTEQHRGLRIYCSAKNTIGVGNSSGVIVEIKAEISKNKDTVMMIIGIIVAVTLVSIVFAVVGMHFATGASCDCGYKSAKKQKRTQLQSQPSQDSTRERDDLAIDLSQFEGGTNQRAPEEAIMPMPTPVPLQETPNNYEVSPVSAPPPPAPTSAPTSNTEGYDNPSYAHNERPNGTAEPQIEEVPRDFKGVVSEEKDGTSHRMKMARKKKREAINKNSSKPVEGDYPKNLPENSQDWIM